MKGINRLVLVLLLLPVYGAFAAQPEVNTPAVAKAAVGAHLGVAVEPVPPVLSAQLPDTVPQGQGVLISRVEPDSPAAAAGLKPFDILLSYDDQKLFSPEQLSRLVATDQAGRSVTLKLVRSGAIETLQATLGKGAPQPGPAYSMRHRPMHPTPFPHPAFPAMPNNMHSPAVVEERFEALNVERLKNGRYRASIEYLDADGNKRSHEFEGSREELRRQIEQAKDMPPVARKHLLNALNFKNDLRMPQFFVPYNLRDFMQEWSRDDWNDWMGN